MSLIGRISVGFVLSVLYVVTFMLIIHSLHLSYLVNNNLLTLIHADTCHLILETIFTPLINQDEMILNLLVTVFIQQTTSLKTKLNLFPNSTKPEEPCSHYVTTENVPLFIMKTWLVGNQQY